MRELPLSNCEKNFIEQAIQQGMRLDGRGPDHFRELKIYLGTEYGSAYCCLGDTRVLANVSCTVTQPKAVRPQEGLIFINVELGPMAASNFEAGRSSDSSVQLNRILERVIKDSRCVDLESLCIVAEEKVWNIRIDVNILNYEGNAVDCASVACLTALAHFKRPDVTINGDEVIIHTLAEKTPIPMVLHHYPVCVSYAIFNDGKQAVADPSYIEERVSEAAIVFGINSYKELCGLHLGGVTLTNPTLLLSCANKGAKRAKTVVDLIKSTLEADAESREKGEVPSFSAAMHEHSITSLAQKPLSIQLKKFKMSDVLPSLKPEPMEQDEDLEDSKVLLIGNKTGVLVPTKKGARTWITNSEEEDEEEKGSGGAEESSDDEDVMIVDAGNDPKVPIKVASDDSEEDETQTVEKMI